MMKIDIHNEAGGVGSTTIAAHVIAGAQEIGARVAAMSLDPARALARELDLGAEHDRADAGDPPDLAPSAGAHAMRVAVFDLLRRAMGPELALDQPSAALPIEPGASATLRHGPHPGFRIARVSPELGFGGDEELGASAELQLLHLDRGRERTLATWTFGEPPPEARDLLRRPQAIGLGEGLLLRITNTGRRPITEARLLVDDDPSLEIHLPRRRHTPRELGAQRAAAVHHAIAEAEAELAVTFARIDAEMGV